MYLCVLLYLKKVLYSVTKSVINGSYFINDKTSLINYLVVKNE